VTNERAWLEQRIKVLGEIEAAAKAEEAPGAKKPPGGGIAGKIKMSAKDLGALKTDLDAKLADLKGAELPLMSLEPKGDGLFSCPREKIVEVVEALGTVEKKTVDPRTTVVSYQVKLKGGGEVTVMEKIDPAADWVAHLKQELSPDALKKLEVLTKGWTPQQIQERWHGDTEVAVEELGRGGEVPKTENDTLDLFGVKPIPTERNARWGYKDDPSHWLPERQKLHNDLLAKAKVDAQKFGDAAPKGEPTLYAMRGNTAAGKTRAVSSNVPELAPAMAATKDANFRAVNPDAFKPELMKGGLTSSQVHPESSMLADRMQDQLRDMKTSDGTQVASILIDKRLAGTGDVDAYAQMAKDTGRKFVLYDVDAPLESSLIGVLERQPGGTDPLPPFDIVASGFKGIHENRLPVIQKFISGQIKGEYYLYGTRANGERVLIGQVRGNDYIPVVAELSAVALSPTGPVEAIAKTRITEAAIDSLTTELTGDRGTMIRNLLRKYIGWTWKDALNAHSRERAPKNMAPPAVKADPKPPADNNGGSTL